MREKYDEDFGAGMGAESIKELLAELDLDQLSKELTAELREASGQKRLRIIKRLEVVESFRLSHNRPEWMILGRCSDNSAGNPPDGTAGRRTFRNQ